MIGTDAYGDGQRVEGRFIAWARGHSLFLGLVVLGCGILGCGSSTDPESPQVDVHVDVRVNVPDIADTQVLEYIQSTVDTYEVHGEDVQAVADAASSGDMSASLDTDSESLPDPPLWTEKASLEAIEIGAHQVTLVWASAVSEEWVANYILTVGGEDEITIPANRTSWLVGELKEATTYVFSLIAVDFLGQRSTPLKREAQTLDVTVPSWANDASLVIAQTWDTGVFLTWAGAQDNVGVSAYEILLDGDVVKTVGGATQTALADLSPWTDHDVMVRALDAAGNISEDALSASFKTTDAEPPTWPQGATVELVQLTAASATLSWVTALDNAPVSSYLVTEQKVLLAMVNDASQVTLNGLTSGTKHALQVWAQDQAGNLSEDALDVSFEMPDGSPPAWPAKSALIASKITPNGLTLAWPPATDDLGVVAYRVQQDGVEVSVTATTHLDVTDLKPWQAYSFSVHAEDAAGHVSEEPLKLSVKTPDQSPPDWSDGLLTITQATAHSLMLTWNEATDDAGVATYQVFQDGVLLSENASAVTYLEVVGLETWTTYHFEVRAVDLAGNISPDVPKASIKTPDDLAPSWVEGTQLSASEVEPTRLTITWPLATDNDAVDQYHVTMDGEGLLSVPADVHELEVTDLQSLGDYVFSVTASDASGNVSPAIHLEVTTTDGDAPSWPDPLLSLTLSNEVDVALGWSEASDAKEVVGYHVFQDGELLGETDATSWQVEGLEPKTSYVFTVEAGDAAGNWSDDGPSASVSTGNPCSPPLSFSAQEYFAAIYSGVVLLGQGGTGTYQFSLDEPDAAGSLNVATGSYLAGSTAGVTHSVTLTDSGCVGSAETKVHTVANLAVSPENAEVPPGGCVNISVDYGSGMYVFNLTKNTSGAVLDESGSYVAGPAVGTDIIRVSDLNTGEYFHVVLVVTPDAGVVASPPFIALPRGAVFQMPFKGGSGVYDVQISGDAVEVEGSSVLGVKKGLVTLTAIDKHIGCDDGGPEFSEAVAIITVAETIDAPSIRYRGNGNVFQIEESGDIDGDGHVDLVLSASGASYEAGNSGAVYVYAGEPGGLNPEPVQILSIQQKGARFGRAITLGDFNGDGQTDVAVSAPAGGGSPSWVHVFYGLEGGFFETIPTNRMSGPPSWYSGYGLDIEACDYNGDGMSDLAVGITGLVDTNKESPPHGQGGFYVYLGRPEGLTDYPNQIRFAETIDLEGNTIAQGLGVGSEMAAGDVDGDGACDLVVRTGKYAIPSTSKSGALLVYPGKLKTEENPGGLGSLPVKVYAAVDDVESGLSGGFAVGDVVDDGAAEIVAAFPYGAGGSGFISMLPGGALPSEDAPEIAPLPYTVANTIVSSFWSYIYGWGGWTYFGTGGVRTRDMNGDGQLDILVGAPRAHPGGTINLYLGQGPDLPAETISHTFAGTGLGGSFGVAFSPVGDLDGDGLLEVAAFSSQNQDFGDTGRPFLIPGSSLFQSGPEGPGLGDLSPVDVAQPLGFPGKRSGAGLGRHMRIVKDLDGDGYDELVVSTSTGLETVSASKGAAMVYRGNTNGFDALPATVVHSFPGASGSYQAFGGYPATGDFDGDGHGDWVAGFGRGYPQNLVGKEPFIFSDVCAQKVASNPMDSATAIFAGGGDALPGDGETVPDFLYYSDLPATSRVMADYNGDGKLDLIQAASSYKGFTGGGVEFIQGRPPNPAGIEIICARDAFFSGDAATHYRLGYTLAALGDLDGDGCHEVAMAANNRPYAKLGTAYIIYGWGPLCSKPQAEVVAFRELSFSYTRITQMAAADMDGDGLQDLLVTDIERMQGDDAFGAVHLIPAARINSLPREPFVSGVIPKDEHLYKDPASPGIYSVFGKTAKGLFGAAVGRVPLLGGDGRDAIVVGSPQSDVGGVAKTGGAFIYRHRFDGPGFDPMPLATIAGETYRKGSQLGSSVDSTLMDGVPTVIVGGFSGTPYMSDDIVDNGTVYTFQFPVQD
jgi:chitodextrinase